jgi:D-hydroxyproline dehydrogenase subunit beta
MEVGVIGAGIVGLAHAWSAAERGHRVTVLERTAQARGASVRNFGMVWPIGQPGEWYRVALRSRQRWLKLVDAGVWVNPCGSIHLAHHEDELAVLREFAERAPALGVECELLSPGEVLARSPAAGAEGLAGGLFSLSELCVNPPTAVRAIPAHLAERYGVRFEFRTTAIAIEDANVRAADGRRWKFNRVIVCGGADFETLYPEVMSRSGLVACKLQMLKTRPQPAGWRIGPHLASGLTLRHYRNFDVCPSLPALKARIAAQTPELDRYGVHVMASQADDGSVILGDSHEYGADIEPFDKTTIDDLMLRELHKILRLPDWTIAARWHGVYAKHPSHPFYAAEPAPGVLVCTGTGGAGMTMAFGLAEMEWERWG